MNYIEKLVYIILVNYNGYKDTIECLNSIENIEYKNYKIIVVDNNSTDQSETIIKNYIKGFDNIHYIQSKENLGFSGGNNLGIRYAIENGADYICLLNNDTIVEKNFLNILCNEMNKNSDVGIASGKIKYYSNKNKIWSAGGYISNIKGCGYHYGEGEYDSDIYNRTKEVTFLTACMQLIKREVIEKVGYYDEKYFLYMEDTDFCHRVIENGYKLLYIPESIIYHKINSSTGTDSPLSIYYSNRNRILYIKKNIKNIYKILSYFYFFSTRIIKLLIDRKNRKYILKGLKDGIYSNFGYIKI